MTSVDMPQIDELMMRARQSVAAKDMPGATAYYEKVLESGDNPEALLHLSNVEARNKGHYRKGREYALRAMSSAVGKPALAPSVLLCLRHFEESEAMRAYIDASPFLRGMADPKTLHMVSAQLSWLGDQKQAIEFAKPYAWHHKCPRYAWRGQQWNCSWADSMTRRKTYSTVSAQTLDLQTHIGSWHGCVNGLPTTTM
jgi:hypothetical protein